MLVSFLSLNHVYNLVKEIYYHLLIISKIKINLEPTWIFDFIVSIFTYRSSAIE